MERYAVKVECLTKHEAITTAYGGQTTETLVFASDKESALLVAEEKMTDKWLRHQNIPTKWRAIEAREDE
jgi:hypothetical protein